MLKFGPYIGVGAGLPLVAAGVFLSQRIKQLWLVYDPERSLAFEPFDYFPLIWEEDEPEEELKDETETSIYQESADESEEEEDPFKTEIEDKKD